MVAGIMTIICNSHITFAGLVAYRCCCFVCCTVLLTWVIALLRRNEGFCLYRGMGSNGLKWCSAKTTHAILSDSGRGSACRLHLPQYGRETNSMWWFLTTSEPFVLVTIPICFRDGVHRSASQKIWFLLWFLLLFPVFSVSFSPSTSHRSLILLLRSGRSAASHYGCGGHFSRDHLLRLFRRLGSCPRMIYLPHERHFGRSRKRRWKRSHLRWADAARPGALVGIWLSPMYYSF